MSVWGWVGERGEDIHTIHTIHPFPLESVIWFIGPSPSPQTTHRQDQPALLQLQQGALLTAALQRETRKERASRLVTTGLTASAGWNFVVWMVLGRRQPASTPTQPSLDHSILSHRSSPTIQSEYYFLMVVTFPFSSHRCGQIPAGCKRCDDECAWRDGKAGREDY